MFKKKKLLLLILIAIAAFAVFVIVFISPISKYLIQKYDETYTGRQITLDWAYVNPFTGFVHLHNVKIYEFRNDTVFFKANGISANFSLFKMLSQSYEISDLNLDHPTGTIIQNKKVFNFNDLIDKFSRKTNAESRNKESHFNIINFTITSGKFYYIDETTPVNYFIKNVNLKSEGKSWDSDTIAAFISFQPGIGTGEVKSNFTINLKNLDYSSAVVAQNVDLSLIEQYLNDITNYGTFRAHIDVNVKAKGNFKNAENIIATGSLAVNDFHFGKTPDDDYVSFKTIALSINVLSPQNRIYLFDSVTISHPYLKYERYDNLNNLETIFGVKGSNIATVKSETYKFNLVIEMARYLKILARNFFQSDYKINRLNINNGDLRYNDYSLREKFSFILNPLNIKADSIYKDYKWIKLSLNSGIQPFGELAASVRINPKDSSDFAIDYKLNKLPASLFNPYIITYTSFPLDKGTIELNGTWNVIDGDIQSNNHLLIIDPRLAKRLKSKDTNHLPLPLILAFIREKGNVIDYEIPITGNLRNPKFHFQDVIFDLLGNIFIKPPTTPYRLQVKSFETEIEKSHTLQWEMTSTTLSNLQIRYVEKIADFLANNSNASITISPKFYSAKEKEYILFFEAKKAYFQSTTDKIISKLSKDDSLKIESLSVKDSLFIRFLDYKVKDSLLFTVQDKCSALIDPFRVNQKFRQLNEDRKNNFIRIFEKRDLQKQVHISDGESIVPYNGFSSYEIKYNDELPKSLLKAYEKMNELDSMSPRVKYRKERNNKLDNVLPIRK